MTQEKFIKVLYEKGYSYEIEGDKIVVGNPKQSWGSLTRKGKVVPDYSWLGHVNLESLETLPPGVVFNNEGGVNLSSLETLPPGVVFRNKGGVILNSLETLPPGVEFNNVGDVNLDSLKTLPPGVEFNNRGYRVSVYLGSLIGGVFSKWKGNIEGIDNKMLLNLMIKQGVFI